MPDLLIREARPLPMFGTSQPATGDAPVDISIADGVVRDIGYRLPRPAGVAEVDAGGRWLLPGLWDKHAHLGQWAAATQRLDLTSTRSAETALVAVAARLKSAPGKPIIGAGMRAGAWPRPAHVRELDSISGSVPVILVNADLHHGWCNTAALDALGLARRDEVVAEAEWFASYPRLDAVAGLCDYCLGLPARTAGRRRPRHRRHRRSRNRCTVA